MKHIRYIIEAALLYGLYFIFKILPVDSASSFGAWLGSTIGSRLGASKKAYQNISAAMPELSEEQRIEHVKNMWRNLGRVFAEYPHLRKIGKDRVRVTNPEVFEQTKALGKGIIFFGAHIGNWEVPAAHFKIAYGENLDLTYRALNNPYADKLLFNARTLGGDLKAFPKGRESGKDIIKSIKNKGFLGILIDQKYNEGLETRFFNKPAMTNPIGVELAQKLDCPIIMVQNKRLDGAHFEITLEEPLVLNDQGGTPLPKETVLANANEILEKWIKEAPEQWLWLHRRWKDESTDKSEEGSS